MHYGLISLLVTLLLGISLALNTEDHYGIGISLSSDYG